MSTHTHAPTSCLATNQRGGVADTEDIERDFVRAMRRRWRLVRGAVRRSVGYQTDAFGLVDTAETRTLGNADQIANERIEELAEPYEERSQAVLIDRFARDFNRWVRRGVLEPTEFSSVRDGQHWTAEFVDASARRGWRDGGERLQQAGAAGVEVSDEALGNLGVSRQRLRRMYDRAYQDLEDITNAAGQTMREELTLGFAAGENPRVLADRLTSEIRSIQRTRAETLARTHVAEAHTSATLDRYEEYGVETVRHGSWLATDDSRTCPICSYLDGKEFPLSDFRTGTFTFSPSRDEPDYLAGEYSIKPPTHPRCRCLVAPIV